MYYQKKKIWGGENTALTTDAIQTTLEPAIIPNMKFDKSNTRIRAAHSLKSNERNFARSSIENVSYRAKKAAYMVKYNPSRSFTNFRIVFSPGRVSGEEGD